MGKAIILDDCDFSQFNLGKVTFVDDTELQSLEISGKSSAIGEEEQYEVVYNPSQTTQRRVAWSIESGSQYATIDQDGLLTILQGATSSSVVIKCQSLDNIDIYATKTVVVTYQQLVINDITVTATSQLVTATLTHNTASELTIHIGNKGDIVIPIGESNGTLSIIPSQTATVERLTVQPLTDMTYRYRLTSDVVEIPAFTERHLMIVGASDINGDDEAGQFKLLDLDTMKQVVGTESEVIDDNLEYLGSINWGIVTGGSYIQLQTSIGTECRVNVMNNANNTLCTINAIVDGTTVVKEITATYAMTDYYVETFADLQKIETAINGKTESNIALTKNPSSSYIPVNGSGLAGARIRLKNDIDCGGSHVSIGKWFGVSSSNNCNFSATFDGCGYEIKDCGGSLTHYNNISSDRIANLFQSVHNATLKNFIVSGSLTGSTSQSGRYGLFCGNITGATTIKNIKSKISFSNNHVLYVSPICSSIDAAITSLTIEDIVCCDTVNITNSTITSAIRCVYGGNFSTLINRCCSIGEYHANGKGIAGIQYLQNVNSNISNCFSNIVTQDSLIGGLVIVGGSQSATLNATVSYYTEPVDCVNYTSSSITAQLSQIYSPTSTPQSGVTQKTLSALKNETLFTNNDFIHTVGYFPILNNIFAADTDVLSSAKRVA